MKKTILLAALMVPAAAAFAQESRQDVSVSGFELIGMKVNGAGGVYLVDQTKTTGVLASYRYLLTPHSALELNYSFAQNSLYFQSNGNPTRNPIHTRQQELSAAYVYGLTFKNYNPFVEGGIAAVVFTPILDGTFTLDAKSNTNIGGLFGAGVAYEISPSFDIRAQYRGIVVKTPDFKLPGDRFKTNRYELIQMPAIGIAYHF